MASTDLRQLRADYLFGLAHICHLAAPQVDALTLTDFEIYTRSIDRMLEVTPGG